MDITLPNGKIITGVPEGTTKSEVMKKAIIGGHAKAEDFPGMAPMRSEVDYVNQGMTLDNAKKQVLLDQDLIGTEGKVPTKVEEREKQSPMQEREILAVLQKEFGDDDTVRFRRSGRGPGGVTNYETALYDKEELLRRYNRKMWGTTPPPASWNPMVHLGKYMKDLHLGGRQLLDDLLPDVIQENLPDWKVGETPIFKAPTKEEYDAWKAESDIYNLTDQPLLAQLAGDVALATPSLATAPIRAAAGIALKNSSQNALLKRLGKNLESSGLWSGRTAPPTYIGTAPGAVGTISGAKEGAVLPVDPDLDALERWGTRGERAVTSGAMGGAIGGLATRYGGKAAQQNFTERMNNRLQPNLPKKVKIPVAALTGERSGLSGLQRLATTESEGFGPEAGRTIISDYHRSLNEAYDAVNKELSGSTNQRVGVNITPVLGAYKRRLAKDKAIMDQAYANARGGKPVSGEVNDFNTFMERLMIEVEGGDINTSARSGPVKEAFRILEKTVVPKKGRRNRHLYDARGLTRAYKQLNSKYLDATEPSQKRAISYMNKRLNDYMSNTSRFTGDADSLSNFRNATALANNFYKKYRGDPVIDKYLDGELTSADVSKRIFSGEAFAFEEKPKAAAIGKLLNIFDGKTKTAASKRLKNELFANLTNEQGFTRAQSALPSMKAYLLSGSEDSVLGKLLSKNELKMFDELRGVMDLFEEGFPKRIDPLTRGLSVDIRKLLNPLGFSRALKDLNLGARQEKRLLAPENLLEYPGARAGAAPFLQQDLQEDDFQRNLDRLRLLQQ